jgi:hypothetical protein
MITHKTGKIKMPPAARGSFEKREPCPWTPQNFSLNNIPLTIHLYKIRGNSWAKNKNIGRQWK